MGNVNSTKGKLIIYEVGVPSKSRFRRNISAHPMTDQEYRECLADSKFIVILRENRLRLLYEIQGFKQDTRTLAANLVLKSSTVICLRLSSYWSRRRNIQRMNTVTAHMLMQGFTDSF